MTTKSNETKTATAASASTSTTMLTTTDISRIEEVRRDDQGCLRVYDIIRFAKGIKAKTTSSMKMEWARSRREYPRLTRCEKGKIAGCRQIQWVCDEDTARAIVSVCTGVKPDVRYMFGAPSKHLLRRVDKSVGGVYALRMKYNLNVVKFGCSTKNLARRMTNYKGFTAPCEVLLCYPMPGATKGDIIRAELCLLDAAETIRVNADSPTIERLEGGNEWYKSTDPTVFDDVIRLFVKKYVI